jgi:O-antigen/teichoic acid export membrane protein
MSARTDTGRAARFLAHLRTPLYRNAYAWLASTGFSSATGVLYWILAARLYPVDVLGLSAALISTLMFISGISQLNLVSALVRFLPTAGPATARFTAYCYLAAGLLTLAFSAAAAALGARLPGLGFIETDWRMVAVFVPAAVAWTIFNLQDGVLTGLRAAVWVPVDNIGYSLVKLVFLIVLQPWLPEWGIFVSWTVPALVMVLPINLLIFGRLIPRHARLGQEAAAPVQLPQLARYIASNYAGSLFSLASGRLLPALVVAVAGATSAAYFYLAWTLANTLKLAGVQMATSLTVEGALDSASMALNSSRFLRLMGWLLVPLVLALVLAAPLVLRLSGPDYADGGSAVLRLLSLSILPSLVVSWCLSIARVRRQLAEIVVAEGVLAALTLGLGWLLLRSQGLAGVGIASVVSTTFVALALLPRFWPALHSRPAGRPGFDSAA